jgi:hypothetical protein
MHDWQTDWWKALDDLAQQVDRACQDLSHHLDELADAWMDSATALSEDIEAAIAPHLNDLDDHLHQWLDPIVDLILELDDLPPETTSYYDDPFAPPQPATPQHHPACIGCHHYHGHIYSGTLLVCAMHPYGWDGDTCPDWEATPPPSAPPTHP